MATNNKSIVLFLIIHIFVISFAAATPEKGYDARAYVKSWCERTLYSDLCVRSLARYVGSGAMKNPQDLARVALKVSLYRAKYTKAFLMKVAKEEYGPVRDCLTQIRDSVNQLTLAIEELNRVGSESMTSSELEWHINSLQTWTSSALTDAETCVSQFQGRRMSKVKASIKGKVKNVEETTSNALAFIQRYAAVRYRARRP
ncbi:PREDICTED: 21 kDa protein [Tarenaya hassleriana]|uniref:21 kDa protein n=1 Tax=Tarenaya hassleriana TaxID=28532 RepID=UPI00053CA9E2|nr:PREDICTED: 21 kDa protein [Tarenaya hassleriana]